MMDRFREQEADKCKKYAAVCRALRGASFIPFVLTPWGGMGPEARKTMARLVRGALGTLTGWERTSKAAMLWQKVSMSLAKGVARQLTAATEVTEPAWSPAQASHSPYMFLFGGVLTPLCQ